VDVFDVREDECAAVFASHGVRDIYDFVELLGGDVMNELARALGLKWNYFALHAEGAFLDMGGLYLYLNTWSLTQVSREHATVQHTHFSFVRLLIDPFVKVGRSIYGGRVCVFNESSLMMFTVNPGLLTVSSRLPGWSLRAKEMLGGWLVTCHEEGLYIGVKDMDLCTAHHAEPTIGQAW
jgi:hypothetical protein